MELPIRLVYKDAVIPSYKTDGAACLDLYAHSVSGEENLDWYSTEIPPFETKVFNTGIAIGIPKGYVGLIFARSGTSTVRGLRPANCVGVIDSDYRGQILVPIHNDFKKTQTIHAGERIAQIGFFEVEVAGLKLVQELDVTKRGDGGFGSTGADG